MHAHLGQILVPTEVPGRTELAQHPIPATVIPERPWWPTWITGDEDGSIRREYAERCASS